MRTPLSSKFLLARVRVREEEERESVCVCVLTQRKKMKRRKKPRKPLCCELDLNPCFQSQALYPKGRCVLLFNDTWLLECPVLPVFFEVQHLDIRGRRAGDGVPVGRSRPRPRRHVVEALLKPEAVFLMDRLFQVGPNKLDQLWRAKYFLII